VRFAVATNVATAVRAKHVRGVARLRRCGVAARRLLSQVGVNAAGETPNRLNWGCGPMARPGWINADRLANPGVDLPGDIRDGLPLADASVDYAVAMHALQELPYGDLEPALRELRRVITPGGVLRIGVPDLDRAIAAYVAGEREYFDVPDADAACIGAKLVVATVGYGAVRTPFTFDFAAELLDRAGFRDVVRCELGRTTSTFEDIVALDDRKRETLFVEARR
jgi:SAM-dependent methyltransferase